jgi:hypothetical protein
MQLPCGSALILLLLLLPASLTVIVFAKLASLLCPGMLAALLCICNACQQLHSHCSSS